MLDAFSLAIINILFFCREINKIKLTSTYIKIYPMKLLMKKTVKKQHFIVVGWFTL